jgi:hypothetical protein
MSKIFCQECGVGNEFSNTGKRPNFCYSCGSAFPWNKAVAAKPTQTQKQEVSIDDYDEEIDLSGAISFDIGVSNNKGITIGDLCKNPSSMESISRVSPRNAKKNLDSLRQRVRETSRIDLD